MGLLSIIKGIITFPFRLIGKIFGRKKESFESAELPPLPPPPAALPPQNIPQPFQRQLTPTEQQEFQRIDTERTAAKLDLVLAELDSLKAMNQTLNERLKQMEKKLEEKERGIRYI